jgi:hypothetical protein
MDTNISTGEAWNTHAIPIALPEFLRRYDHHQLDARSIVLPDEILLQILRAGIPAKLNLIFNNRARFGRFGQLTMTNKQEWRSTMALLNLTPQLRLLTGPRSSILFPSALHMHLDNSAKGKSPRTPIPDSFLSKFSTLHISFTLCLEHRRRDRYLTTIRMSFRNVKESRRWTYTGSTWFSSLEDDPPSSMDTTMRIITELLDEDFPKCGFHYGTGDTIRNISAFSVDVGRFVARLQSNRYGPLMPRGWRVHSRVESLKKYQKWEKVKKIVRAVKNVFRR